MGASGNDATARAHRHFDRIDDSREISQISMFVIKNNVDTELLNFVGVDIFIKTKRAISHLPIRYLSSNVVMGHCT